MLGHELPLAFRTDAEDASIRNVDWTTPRAERILVISKVKFPLLPPVRGLQCPFRPAAVASVIALDGVADDPNPARF
jgi:hypothetical protein